MSNPFDDDADNDYFTKPSSTGGGKTSGSNYTSSTTSYTSHSYTKGFPINHAPVGDEGQAEEDWNFYERQIEDAMQGSLASTQRSLRALEESEAVGVGTAEDLLVQGEKLRNVDKRLDEINSTTGQTQKHLNNIKSVFGGIKNYFAKGPKDPPPPKTAQSAGKLETTVGKLKTDTSGFYSEESSTSKTKGQPVSYGQKGERTLTDSSRGAIQGTRWAAMDDEIDENLDVMSDNLRRLRNLGSALGSEIDDQNQLLDRLAPKTEKVDTVIRDQDRQMKKILGHKPKDKKQTDNAPQDLQK